MTLRPRARHAGIALLASVRNLAEAREAAAAGADLIDLKDPAAGALGALAAADIVDIAAAIRADWPQRPVSATIGDFAPADHEARCAWVFEVAATGVDYVKVGIEPGVHATVALDRLAGTRLSSLVIVFLADAGIDLALAEHAAAIGFAGIMVDTGDKSTGSLLRHADPASLRAFIEVARRRELLCGLAGSLRRDDVGLLRQLAPDYAGFRGALCDGDRRGRLQSAKVRELRASLCGEPLDVQGSASAIAPPAAPASSSARSLGNSVLPSRSIG
jgi:(5-formylfuran-3-yl)methyl phosphate synthase